MKTLRRLFNLSQPQFNQKELNQIEQALLGKRRAYIEDNQRISKYLTEHPHHKDFTVIHNLEKIDYICKLIDKVRTQITIQEMEVSQIMKRKMLGTCDYCGNVLYTNDETKELKKYGTVHEDCWDNGVTGEELEEEEEEEKE
jgi:hypothetical protein